MPGTRTDASIALSVKDNLSQSIVGMKNSLNRFKNDAEGLQQQLDTLTATKFQLKNFDLKAAKAQVDQMRQALESLGDSATDAERAAARADFDEALQNYSQVEQQLNLVSKQARQTEKDLLNATDAISKTENRAGRSGGAGILSSLGQAGALSQVGEVVSQWAQVLVTSAYGSEAASLFSGALSGAGSGAAIGSMVAPGIGTILGALAGGALGAVQGASQTYQAQDEAFKVYYQQLYESGTAQAEESLTSGSATAAQRELDAIAFVQLLGEDSGSSYLRDLRTLAADTPLEYADLTQMSRALATGFGDSPERMLELLEAIGNAGSAVGVTASDMSMMAQAMSRMNSSGKATLEYLNILQERGVDVIGMLAEEYGKTQGEIYDMISAGDINGQEAVDVIQRGMEARYGGAMETMAQTFSGLTSTLEDTMAELDNARGEGYNTERSQGLQAEIDAYGGALGQAVESINTIAGQNQAYLENLQEQYTREALSAVLLGEDTTLFDSRQQAELEKMRESFLQASAEYDAGSQEAGLQMDSLRRQAESLATAAYESSEQYQLVQDTELTLIDAIRQNTAALQGWKNEYNRAQALSLGQPTQSAWSPESDLMDALIESRDEGDPEGVLSYPEWVAANPLADPSAYALYRASATADSHAAGLVRVPYDNYAALLHEGERVLTASQTRELDRGGSGGSVTVNLSGSWTVRSEEDAEELAEILVRKIELAQKAGVIG